MRTFTDTERLDFVQRCLAESPPEKYVDRRGTYRDIAFRIDENRTIREELDRQLHKARGAGE